MCRQLCQLLPTALPSTPSAPIQMIEPIVAKVTKRTYPILATPAAYGNAARANGMHRDTTITGAP